MYGNAFDKLNAAILKHVPHMKQSHADLPHGGSGWLDGCPACELLKASDVARIEYSPNRPDDTDSRDGREGRAAIRDAMKRLDQQIWLNMLLNGSLTVAQAIGLLAEKLEKCRKRKTEDETMLVSILRHRGHDAAADELAEGLSSAAQVAADVISSGPSTVAMPVPKPADVPPKPRLHGGNLDYIATPLVGFSRADIREVMGLPDEAEIAIQIVIPGRVGE